MQTDYVAKNWALAMILKTLSLVHFWSVLLLKEQMMTSVRKMLKTLVWSAQISDRFLVRFALKITTKLAVFHWLLFGEVCPENSCKIPVKPANFSANLSLKIPWNWTFPFATYQKPWQVQIHVQRNILQKNIKDEKSHLAEGKPVGYLFINVTKE